MGKKSRQKGENGQRYGPIMDKSQWISFTKYLLKSVDKEWKKEEYKQEAI